MKIRVFAIFFIIIGGYVPFAMAKDECKPNLTGFDVCEYARNFADEFASQLPMKMSKNLTLSSVIAYKSLVSLQAILGYDKKYLQDIAKQGNMSWDELNVMMEKSTKANLCVDNTPTEAFIHLGGTIQYDYKFNDGMPYITVTVNKCD